MVVKYYDGTEASARKLVRLTAWARRDLSWSLRKVPVWESIRITTDDMDTAIGAVIEGRTMYEKLDHAAVRKKISHKKWLAIVKVVLANLQDLKGRVVTWHVDNTNVRFAWMKSGTVRDSWL